MGWLFRDTPLSAKGVIDEITRICTFDGPRASSKPLAVSRVGNTVYAAVQTTYKEGAETVDDGPYPRRVLSAGKSYTFAAVFLIRNNKKDGFGYKDMDESSGPCEVACPQHIMKLLSPFEDFPGGAERSRNEYARQWRENVAAYHAKQLVVGRAARKLGVGSMITLPYALRYGAREYRHFKVVPTPPRVKGLVFLPMRQDGTEVGMLVRVRRHYLTDAQPFVPIRMRTRPAPVAEQVAA